MCLLLVYRAHDHLCQLRYSDKCTILKSRSSLWKSINKIKNPEMTTVWLFYLICFSICLSAICHSCTWRRTPGFLPGCRGVMVWGWQEEPGQLWALVGQHTWLAKGQSGWWRIWDMLPPPYPRWPQKPVWGKGQSPEQDQTLHCRSGSSLC